MVLLVDDQPIVGESIRRILSNASDINSHYCRESESAVAMALDIKPTVILQDLVMPGIDGFELLTRYRANEQLKDVPVIVLSVKEDPAIKSETFTRGANDYLVKVPDEIELLARIRMHSHAYIDQQERDAAYRALRESQRHLLETNTALQSLNQQLQDALANVKQLSGLLPICSYCKRIRNDQNYWEQVERYIGAHSDAKFTHGICPTCYDKVISES